MLASLSGGELIILLGDKQKGDRDEPIKKRHPGEGGVNENDDSRINRLQGSDLSVRYDRARAQKVQGFREKTRTGYLSAQKTTGTGEEAKKSRPSRAANKNDDWFPSTHSCKRVYRCDPANPAWFTPPIGLVDKV
ncbi:hypothetical protein KUV89_01355 [Marinobacter hydrocarbonoclasticus]|nr:hypothetical protein [Marinobacter nauticus]